MLWVTLGPEEPEQEWGRVLHVASPPVWKLASHWLLGVWFQAKRLISVLKCWLMGHGL